jgi:hypothetical protein
VRGTWGGCGNAVVASDGLSKRGKKLRFFPLFFSQRKAAGQSNTVTKGQRVLEQWLYASSALENVIGDERKPICLLPSWV